MNTSTEFRASLVEAAIAVMHCEYCCEQALPGDQLQPGWVGRDYVSGRGVVVVLQNPAVPPPSYDPQRESRFQGALRDFSTDPSLKTYEHLMQLAFDDMTGVDGVPPWPKWTHPIGKLFDQPNRAAEELRAAPHCSRLAWMNVVKFRTDKNRAVPSRAVHHSIDMHLKHELELLRPKALVSIGSAARKALSALSFPSNLMRGHLKLQGASNAEVKSLQMLLHASGADL